MINIARRITAAGLESADLVVAMEDSHARSDFWSWRLIRAKVSSPTHFLIPSLSRVPAYLTHSLVQMVGSHHTLAAIEAAMPGLLDRIRTLQQTLSLFSCAGG